MAIIRGSGIPMRRSLAGLPTPYFRNIPPSFQTPNLGGLGQDASSDFFNFDLMSGPNSPDSAVEQWLTTGNVTAGDTSTSSWDWNSIINNITKVGTAVLSLEQQRQLADINLQRAQAGLSPLSASQFAPQMNVGVAPDVQKLIMYGGIGLLGVLLFNRSKSKSK